MFCGCLDYNSYYGCSINLDKSLATKVDTDRLFDDVVFLDWVSGNTTSELNKLAAPPRRCGINKKPGPLFSRPGLHVGKYYELNLAKFSEIVN